MLQPRKRYKVEVKEVVVRVEEKLEEKLNTKKEDDDVRTLVLWTLGGTL